MRTLRLPLAREMLVGLGGLAVICLVLYLTVRLATGGFSSGYELRARFAVAGQGLIPGSDVKVRGVRVGEVRSVRLTGTDTALVTLHMQDNVHVPLTATAAIRPVSLFGPKYVDLIPGRDEPHGPYLAAGATLTRTSSAVELGDILARSYPVLAAIDPQELATVVDSLAQGVEGMGPQLSDVLVNGRRVGDMLAARSPDIQSMIGDFGSVAGEVAPRAGRLVVALRDLGVLGPDLAGRTGQLAGLLDGATRVAGDFAEPLAANAAVIRSGVDGTARLMAAAVHDPPEVPRFVDALQTFFGVLSNVIRVRLPDGTWDSVGHSVSSNNPCYSLGGACGGPGGGGPPPPSSPPLPPVPPLPPLPPPTVPTTLPPPTVPTTLPPLTVPFGGG